MPSGAPLAAPGRRLLTAALILLAAALSLTPISNNDIFLHLRTGTIILDTGAVPRVDDYSVLARGRPFVAHEWLAGVIFRLVQRLGGAHGFDALIVLKFLIAAATLLVLRRVAARLGADDRIAAACGAFVVFLAAARVMERPHLFSYLLTAGCLLWLARRRARARTPLGLKTVAPLILMQVLWTNLHGSFLLGPVIVLIAAAAAGIEGLFADRAGRGAGLAEARRLALTSLLLVGACLLNPYGVALLRFPFALTGSAFMGQIYEWLPPYTEPFRSTCMAREYLIWVLVGGVAHGVSLARARRRGLPPGGLFPALLFGALLALSLRMNRNVTDFALATFPGVAAAIPVSAAFRRAPARGSAALAAAVSAVAMLVAVFGYPLGRGTVRHTGFGLGPGIPVAAADYVEAQHLRGAVFNTYAAGAYLVYRFHPGVRVAMDSRNDVYGETLWTEYTRACAAPDDLGKFLARLDAGFAFLEWSQQGFTTTAAALRALPGGWRPVYFDDEAAVYVAADGPHADLASRDAYAILEPSLFRPGSWSPEVAARALPETDRAVAASHGAYIARVMRIEALRTLGRGDEADREEAGVVAADPPLFHIQVLLGMAHAVRGEAAPATARFQRALELNPASDAARQGLALLERSGTR
ncbi:MAG TPA: hypothetical protein VMQ62_02160 [Dongiaceae bacterium]|nr:hypothetical protein [Dongiaceae bacterium]